MKHLARAIAALTLLAPASAPAATADEVFAEGEHCVAYRTVKGMFFRFDVEVVGKSCQVSAALFPGDADSGARVAVEVPIESFRSGNFLRDGSVRDLLGAEEQPAVHFVSAPLEIAALRQWISDGRIPLSGVLTVGGRDVPVVFDLELFGHGDLHFVRGSQRLWIEQVVAGQAAVSYSPASPSDARNSLISPAAWALSCVRAASMPSRKMARASLSRFSRASC